MTRENIRKVLMSVPNPPELFLWIDDDNPVTAEHFDQLLAGLDAKPEADGIFGWCWIFDSRSMSAIPT